MKTITVTVEPKHEKAGKPCDPCGCAMTLAIRDAGYPHAETTSRYWWISISTGFRLLTLPKNAQQFIADFDAGRPVRVPATFVLPVEAM